MTKNNNPHFHDISAIFEGNILTDDLLVKFSKQKNKNIKKIRQIVTERREKGFCLNSREKNSQKAEKIRQNIVVLQCLIDFNFDFTNDSKSKKSVSDFHFFHIISRKKYRKNPSKLHFLFSPSVKMLENPFHEKNRPSNYHDFQNLTKN